MSQSAESEPTSTNPSTESSRAKSAGTPSTRAAIPFWLRSVPWGVIVLALSGLGWVYANRGELDPAIVNLSTSASFLLGWLCVWTGLWLNGWPRYVWLTICVAPILALAVFFTLYRIERFDGQLSPIFRKRWAAEPALPQVATNAADVAASRFTAAPTDFPQFLGPNRSGAVEWVRLDPNWQERPPTVLWKVPIGDGWSSFAVQGDAAITMEQRDAQEWVSCYDLADGRLIWKHEIPGKHTNPMGGPGPRSTPTIADDKVYAMSAVSQLVCLELVSGKLIWQQELLDLAKTNQAEFEKGVAWGRSASPLVYDGAVFISLGGAQGDLQTLVAFDAASGEELGRAGTNQISYSSPTLMQLDGQPQIALIDEQSLTAYHPANLTQLWSVPWPGSSAGSATASQPQQVDEQRVFMSKGYGTGCQLIQVSQQAGEWTAEVVWDSSRSLRTKFTSAVLHSGYAYGLSDGILECVDLKTGERVWKKGRYQQGQVLLVHDLLLITSEAGEVALVRASPAGYEELAKQDFIGDVTWNNAALSGDRLLIRNSDEAACIRLPVLPPADGEEPDPVSDRH